MSSPKVTVVIPVYNVRDYIEECLDSVVGQSLHDIEIVCVNDGSTDGSREILYRYADADSRIRIVDQANAGLSAARNVGARVASGEYLYFLDSDDYIDTDALERLYARASEDRLDVLYFNGRVFYENDEVESSHADEAEYFTRVNAYDGVMSGSEMFVRMSEHDDHKPMVPMQLFRTQFYEDSQLSFYEGIVHEDNLFSFLCALQAQRAGYTPAECFHRRVRGDSIVTTAKGVKNFKGFLVTYVEMLRFAGAREYDDETSSAIARLASVIYGQALMLYCTMPPEERAEALLVDSRPDALVICDVIKHHGDEKLRARQLKSQLVQAERTLAKLKASRAYRLAQAFRRMLFFVKPRRG